MKWTKIIFYDAVYCDLFIFETKLSSTYFELNFVTSEFKNFKSSKIIFLFLEYFFSFVSFCIVFSSMLHFRILDVWNVLKSAYGFTSVSTFLFCFFFFWFLVHRVTFHERCCLLPFVKLFSCKSCFFSPVQGWV